MSADNTGIYGGLFGSLLAVAQLGAISLEGLLVTCFYGCVGATVGFFTQLALRRIYKKKGWNY